MARNALVGIAAAITLCAGASMALAQVGTAFTYQGQLKDSGTAVNGIVDMQFSLWTAASGGSQVGSTVTKLAVPAAEGLLTTSVDFGTSPYTADQAMYLQIAVRNPAGSGSYVQLTSRQRLTAAPFSLATRGINVLANGSVGLGTTSPQTSLEVVHNAGGLNDPAAVFHVQNCGEPCGQENYQEMIRLYNENENGQAGMGFIVGSPATTNMNTTPNVWVGTSNNSPTIGNNFIVSTKTAPTTLTDRFFVNGTTGAAGFGTTVPAERLHVVGSAPALRLEDIGVVKSELQLLEGGGGLFGTYLRYNSATNACSMGSYNVNAPGPQLDVPLVTWARGSSSAVFAGNITCVSLTQTSSREFKQDILPLSGALDSIMKLRGVTYAWNDKAPQAVRGGHDIGFIAEEMNAVLPDIVAKDPDGKPIGIDYGKITPVAVEAIKQLKNENDQLKARLERLEALMTKAAK